MARRTPRPPRDPLSGAYRAQVDRTLLRESLRLTPEERLERLVALVEFQDELQRAGVALRRGRGSRGRRPG